MSNNLDNKREKFSRFCAMAVYVLALIFMAYLLPMSLLRTTQMSTGGEIGEVVRFYNDNFFLNTIILIISTAMVYLVFWLVEHVSLRKITAILMGWTLIAGIFFVCSAKLQPSEDSYIVSFFARQCALGDSSYYHDYFKAFPFQLGFVLYEEIFFRLFYLVLPRAPEGYSSLALQCMNVVWLAVGYFAVLKATALATRNESVTKLAAVLLGFFLPPLLLTTYMYGNIPGFALAVLGVWMFLDFEHTHRWYTGILTAVFLTLAVCVKLNYLIFVVAVGIVWVIRLIKKPQFKSALLLVVTVALVLGVKGLPQKYYERRCEESFGGVPQLSWMAMGLNEGKSCSGWYDSRFTATAYKASGFDRDSTAALAKAEITDRVKYFAGEPAEAVHFFSRKILSQWNEPTYQGLWNNQVRKNYSEPGQLFDVICHKIDGGLTRLMNYYQQLIFFGFTLGLVCLMRNKGIRASIFPLIVLGGLLYHLLFEAKSQYAMPYIILMIPVAAYGFVLLSDRVGEQSGRRKDLPDGQNKKHAA